MAAVDAARSAATGQAPPGLPPQVAINTALAQLVGRTAALTATVQSVVGDFNIVHVQVGDLISAVGGLQNATHSQRSGFARVRVLRTRLREQLRALNVIHLDGPVEACVPQRLSSVWAPIDMEAAATADLEALGPEVRAAEDRRALGDDGRCTTGSTS